MKRKAHEIEAIAAAMFAAIPFYLTQVVSIGSVLVFHLCMVVIGLVRLLPRRELRVSPRLLGVAGAAYLLFFPFDIFLLHSSLVQSSAHLLFFITVYQTLESDWKDNSGQRLLVTFLIFVTSVATSTHMSITLFVVAFGFLAFRRLMQLSHDKTSLQTGREYPEVPVSRGAFAYIIPVILVAAMMFPMLPRVRDPFIHGSGTGLGGRTTGVSDTIDLTVNRNVSSDPTVVARVWMGLDTIPFFTPLRLRSTIYDRYRENAWRTAPSERRLVYKHDDTYVLSRGEGFSREATVQQRYTRNGKLYIPVGTHALAGPEILLTEGDRNYFAPDLMHGSISYTAVMSPQTAPLVDEPVSGTGYPITPEIRDLARAVAGNATTPEQAAERIQQWMLNNFQYVANVNDQVRPISIEQFLLRDRRGHCEYFATGMVVLLTALDIPARVVGGFYGGKWNPLGGYFVLRATDAHAWTEVWNGREWRTYDSTPPALRPGMASEGMASLWAGAVTDSVTYYWDRWVLTYGLADQLGLLTATAERVRSLLASAKRDLAGFASEIGELIRFLLALIGVGLLLLLLRFRPRRRNEFEELARRLERLGMEIPASMTAEELLEALRKERPDLLPLVEPVVEEYVLRRFSNHPVSAESRRAARRALAELRHAS